MLGVEQALNMFVHMYAVYCCKTTTTKFLILSFLIDVSHTVFYSPLLCGESVYGRPSVSVNTCDTYELLC